MNDFATFGGRLILRGKLQLRTALRVGSGETASPAQADQPVVKDAYGRPYVPGSTLKGVLRNHIEGLLRQAEAVTGKEGLACVSVPRKEQGTVKGCLSVQDVADIKSGDSLSQEMKETKIIENTCLVCRVFGAPWLAGKTHFRDLPVVEATWFDHFGRRDGVAIDRETGTAAEGLKYDFEVVPLDTAFALTIVVEDATPEEEGLVFLVLKELERESVALGGGRTRGLGWVALDRDWASASERVPADRDGLLAYLTDGTTLPLDEDYVTGRLDALKRYIEGSGSQMEAGEETDDVSADRE